MRPQKIQDEELLKALSNVFRTKGYEGASLNELSEATGLKKASLYHRFPQGKQEMAESVLEYMDTWVIKNIFNALDEEGLSPEIRLANGLSQISSFYDGGRDSCIFRALSMQAGLDLFQQMLAKGMEDWLAAFKRFGLSVGQSDKLAAAHAIQTFIDIQGSLILSKGLQDPTIFEDTLKKIAKRYT